MVVFTYRPRKAFISYGNSNHLPKHVELIGIANKPLLLHLVVVYIIVSKACYNEVPSANFAFNK